MTNTAYTLGRALLAILFIVLGVQNILGADGLAKMLTGLPPLPVEIDQYLGGLSRYVALAYLVAIVEIICAIMLLLGFKARWAAIVLMVYVLCTIFFVHNFWDMEGAVAASQRMAVLMDLAIIGGLLLIAGGGAGPDNMARR